MSPEFQHASFIPKRPLVHIPNQKNATRRRRKLNIFGIVSAVIFGVGLLGAGGVYIYNDTLAKEIDALRARLDAETARIKEKGKDFVEDIKTVHAQIKLAEDVIVAHVSPSGIFEVIGDVTVQSAQLTSVAFDGAPEADAFKVEIAGVVQSFESLVRQADVYRSDERILAVTIGDTEVGETGEIVFNAQLTIVTDPGKYAEQFPPIEPESAPKENAVPAPGFEDVPEMIIEESDEEESDVPVTEEPVPATETIEDTTGGLDTFDQDFSDLEQLLNEEF